MSSRSGGEAAERVVRETVRVYGENVRVPGVSGVAS